MTAGSHLADSPCGCTQVPFGVAPQNMMPLMPGMAQGTPMGPGIMMAGPMMQHGMPGLHPTQMMQPAQMMQGMQGVPGMPSLQGMAGMAGLPMGYMQPGARPLSHSDCCKRAQPAEHVQWLL